MGETATLKRLVRRFPGTRVLVIGDLMLDQFVWGDVSRISPEAPVPIVRVRKQEGRPGGAGNVVSNVVALGGRADACGFVGDDLAGRALCTALTSAGGGLAGVVRSRALATTAKTRVIAHSQQVVRFDQDPDDGALPARLTARLRAWVAAHARRYAVIVVSDYGKGVVTPALLGDLAELRRRHGFVYVIDPKRPNFAHYRGASLIKPNLGEASVAAGIEIDGRASLDAAGAALLQRWEADAILISRGEEGMSLFKPKARAQHFPTAAQEVYDVTGAGDTVLAACALALASGGTFEEAARLANQAAGVAVGKVGTATVTARELLRVLAAIAEEPEDREDSMKKTARGVRSMTGYGAAAEAIPGGRITIELRTVNQRFLDVRITAPREYAPWEATCRELVQKHVARGRVEVYVNRHAPSRGRTRVVLNVEAARDYATAWRKVAAELGVKSELDLGLLRGSEIFETVEMPRDLHKEFPVAGRVLARALATLDRARAREGRNLQRDMQARVARLGAIERTIRTHAAAVAGELQIKVNERLQSVLKGSTVDPARVAQEVAYLAERSDVTEELVRLRSHLDELKKLLRGGGSVGKQIEFLLQETHREINTIGSKVNQLEITRLVVEAKGEVERLREQVQNVE